jgi:hypothetical protein
LRLLSEVKLLLEPSRKVLYPPRLSSKCRGVSELSFNDKEMEFLRLLCTSEHKQLGQDTLRDRLIEGEVIELDEFKALKKKLLYAGIIGIVYGNITVQDLSILSLFKDDEIES